jgi:methylenetetrahydrofolate--tRNA-(uracil-5-)-methyltransferase
VNKKVRIIGAGLAGSEAAWQLATRGIPVELSEMRPTLMSKAHKTSSFAELVCSNSFRGADLANAVGLLKEELRRSGSLIMKAADIHAVPAGGALAVDRVLFSEYVDSQVRNHPLVTVRTGEETRLPDDISPQAPLIVATGPLTSAKLATDIERVLGFGRLSFFDAISPIILGDSLDLNILFKQSRYQKGDGDDYLNIPLNEEEYLKFVADVAAAEKFGGHEEVEADSIENLRPFEGCMPIEEMVSRGRDTLLYGPLKPVGLLDPRTGKRPYAVMQLRQDDKEGILWSMVGMQTRMKHGEQQRIFCSLPGMANAEFVRLGSVHRNSFIDSPRCLTPTLEVRNIPGLYFAGQVTGVEGYVESSAAGFVAGLNIAKAFNGEQPTPFPLDTAIGSLIGYVSDPARTEFQPMNISFGLMSSYAEALKDKKRHVSKRDFRREIAERALQSLALFLAPRESLQPCSVAHNS